MNKRDLNSEVNKKIINKKKNLSFIDDIDSVSDSEKNSSDYNDLPIKKIKKDPNANTKFLPDSEREGRIEKLKNE